MVPTERTATEGVAIIGWHGRFPGSPDLEAFWQSLRAGVEGILEQMGVASDSLDS